MPNLQATPDETLPSLAEIDSAAALVHSVMPPTPQYRWPMLCERLGMDLWLKHENHTPLGAFKIRGGLVYFADLAQRGGVERVVSATRGNHGQSVAFAARRHGIEPIVVVPLGNSAEKNAAMRALGARLIEHGHDFQEAREFAEAFAEAEGASMVPSFHPSLVRGVATYGAELFRAVDDIDTVYVPIGLGSGICATVAARNALSPSTKVVGVVSAHAPAYALSFASKRPVDAEVSTLLADGMACRTPEPQALDIIWRHVDRIVDVSDDEVGAAMRLIFECTHNCAEGAGAAALAAAAKEREKTRGRKVAAVLSGGNVDTGLFAGVLAGRSAKSQAGTGPA
ncbi:MAG TPA: threonine dehydratase [Burkholderiaceae bacterium]|mgnify:CR=1 FL=1|nr:threonine dehydratase [Burkholderiaceae bacterium]